MVATERPNQGPPAKVGPRTLVDLRRALAAAIAVPLVLLVGAAWFDRERLFDEAGAAASTGAGIMREHASAVLQTHELIIRELERHTRGMTWEEIQAHRGELIKDMQASMVDRPQISAIVITDTNDLEQVIATLAGAPQPPQGQPAAEQEYWAAQRHADQGTYISAPYVGQYTRRTNFAISRRRVTPDGTFDGTVHVAVASEYFTRFWAESLRDRPGIVVALIRTDGQILARYPSVTPLPRLTAETSPLMRLLASGQDSGVYVAPSVIDGGSLILGYSRVGAYPAVATYGISQASVLNAWYRHLAVLCGIAGLTEASLVLAIASAIRQTTLLDRERMERADIETAAQDAQKLEVLGQLAAGMAHDFRNVLHAVQGAATLIENATAEDRTRSLARTIVRVSQRGEALSRQLTGIAHQDTDAAEQADPVLDPVATVTEVCHLLSTTLGAKYKVLCDAAAEHAPALVRGDRSELERALLNLAVNARDAMPDGGQIRVQVAPHLVAESASADGQQVAGPDGLQPGAYARISVIDSGRGMTPEVLARAGALFFTTKPRGKGTGLGLAAVRSFAERAGGCLVIESILGQGTSVAIWLPDATPDPLAGQS
jgi:signal transduction histidine kinase